MSPSLQRARKPFLIPNIIVGSCVALFTVGVYAYSISAVKQDDFVSLSDLPFIYRLPSTVYHLPFTIYRPRNLLLPVSLTTAISLSTHH